MTPRNKHESTDLFARGCYGNNIEQWENWREAVMASDGPFVIRYKGPPGVQGPAIYGIHIDNLCAEWESLIAKGWQEENLYVNGEIPKERVVFQGELSTGNWADTEWLLVGCEDSGIHMREAMKRSTFKVTGWRAREYLRKHMDWCSWDDLVELIDLYPDGVIELVIFDTPYGSLAHTGRSVIFWEVRSTF